MEEKFLDCNGHKDLTSVLVEKKDGFYVCEVYKPRYFSRREVYSVCDLMRRCKEYEKNMKRVNIEDKMDEGLKKKAMEK